MRWILFFVCLPILAFAEVKPGIEVLFSDPSYTTLLRGKRVGLISNQSAVTTTFETTFEILKKRQGPYTLAAVFAPEHGFYGAGYANEKIADQHHIDGISLHNLDGYGSNRRPTDAMLAEIDLLIFDIQDIGSRSYSYISTLFYCMEEAAKRKIPFLVLDRPNPMGGVVVDGPLVEKKWRSFLGYVNIPYCHGMTTGELAHLFNEEYKIGCKLTVVPMHGWKRGMVIAETGLPWIPTSPQIPEPDTPFFYPTTGLIGHCSLTSIGIGYTLPFKLVGAPWIDGETFAATLNKQKLQGVHFQPFYFRPFFGKYKLKNCQGVRIVITDPHTFLPITTQFTLMGVLKNLYPKQFEKSLADLPKAKQETFHKLSGSEEIFRLLSEEKYVIWKLREHCVHARTQFLPVRERFLNPDYN